MRQVQIDSATFKRIKDGVQPALLLPTKETPFSVGEEILIVDKERQRQVFKTVSHVTRYTGFPVSVIHFGVVPPTIYINLEAEPLLPFPA